jgi:tetratricopeptide (TPR) repeat protein
MTSSTDIAVLVCLLWLGSRVLHETAHSLTIYLLAPPAVRRQYQLSWHPLRYSHPWQSWFWPACLLIFCTIPLPARAPGVQRYYLAHRWQHSLSAVAGPMLTLILLAIALWIGLTLDLDNREPIIQYFLLEAAALLIMLLPVPGTDAYAAIEPWLSPSMQRRVEPWKKKGLYALLGFLLCSWSTIQESLPVRMPILRFSNTSGGFAFLGLLLMVGLCLAWDNRYKEYRDVNDILSDAFLEEEFPEEKIVKQQGVAQRDLKMIEQLIREQPKQVSPFLWVQRSRLLIQLDRVDEVLENYDRGLEYHPQNTTLWRSRGLFLAEQQQFQAALVSYQRATELGARSIDDFHYQGDAQLELGQYDAALKSYDRALARSPGFGHIWADRGYVLKCLGQDEEALKSFDRAIQITPSDSYAWYHKIKILEKTGDRETVSSTVRKAISYDPKSYALGIIYLDVLEASGDLNTALLTYDALIPLHAQDVNLSCRKAKLLIRLKQIQPAHDLLQTLAIESLSPSQLRLRARIAYHCQAYASALSDCQLSLQQQPKNLVSLELQGQILTELGEYEAAIESYQTLLAEDPERYWISIRLGLLLGKINQPEAELSIYESVLQQRPDDLDLLYLKAITLAELNRITEAKATAEMLLQQQPDHELARAIVEAD